jgi:hypothetical protein
MPAQVGSFKVIAALRWEEQERLLLAEDPVLQRRVWIWMRPEKEPRLAPRRSEIARGTRPRWLAGGQGEGWRWDAFVAVPGCPLPLLAADGWRARRLPWMQTLELLTQLTEELTAAEAEGTLPARLSVEQVWVEPTGRVMLLDTPLRPPSAPWSAQSTDSLLFLEQVAELALEGRFRSAKIPPEPIQAPVPGPAREMLNRLVGASTPFATLREFHTALEAVREEPNEVAPPRRALGIALQALFLAPGLLCLFGLGPLFLAAGFGVALLGALFGEDALQEQRERLTGQVALLPVLVDPYQRLAAVAGLEAEVRRWDELEQRQHELLLEREVMLGSTSWFIRQAVEPAVARVREQVQKDLEQRRADRAEIEEADDSPAQISSELLGLPAGVAEELVGNPDWVISALGLWPFLWLVGAALFRGGWSLRLSGLRLEQNDGRPAARWRCVWRCVLVWAPIYLLLLGSLGGDLWRVAVLTADPQRDLAALTWSSWLAWWLAAGLVAFYPWVAVRWPNRGPHDWLAGTDVVPR